MAKTKSVVAAQWWEEVIREMNTADRLYYSMRKRGIKTQEMADYIGVSVSAISLWTRGSLMPRVGVLRLWALKTEFPFEWLAERYDEDLAEAGEVRRQGLEPRTRWLRSAADLGAAA